MPNVRRVPYVRLGVLAAAITVAVTASSLVVLGLERELGVPDASSVYVVAVVLVAIGFGVAGAAFTAAASVLAYDLLFTEPRFTLTVSDPGEWLNLVLLLFVAVAVGQLAALQRQRAESAEARARESRALFEVTRALAARDTTIGALPSIAGALARDARMDRLWFALGSDDADERVVAASGAGPMPAPARSHAVLQRADPGGFARWAFVHDASRGRDRRVAGQRQLRVRLDDGGHALGSLWAIRGGDDALPDEATTRLLGVTADLVSQALGHDRLADETRRAEIAQQSDALKTALLESVSHDLRTPLASIRASAGTLMDAEVHLGAAETRASAASIDREAQRLNRLVGNLLDLSRIEGGALRVTEDALDLEDVVTRSAAVWAADLGARRMVVDLPPEAAVVADPVLLEEAIHNLLENAVRHTPDGATIRVSARIGGGLATLTVEDSGAGVPEDVLPRIFEKFYRVRTPDRATRGTGLGLAVVRGFVEAMHGHVGARRSELGGLAVDVHLPVPAPVPVESSG